MRVTRCRQCNGSGEIHIHRPHDCDDCRGIGYLWDEKPFPKGKVPNLKCTDLEDECCIYHSKVVFDNANQILERMTELSKRVIIGEAARLELESLQGKK